MVPRFRPKSGSGVGKSRLATIDQIARRERAVAKKKAVKPGKNTLAPETAKLAETEVRQALREFGKSFAKLPLKGKPSQSGIANALLRRNSITAIKDPQLLLNILRGMEQKGLLNLPPPKAVGGARKKA